MAKGRKRPASTLSGSSPLPSPATATEGVEIPKSSGNGNLKNGTIRVAAPDDTVVTDDAKSQNNEVRFGKHLASSDKKVRDRTVSTLREWLHQRSKGGALTDLDLLKIWRGLWYCMFMCDKAPIQRELAQNLSGLINLFKDDRTEGVRFFRAFCITMQRDWEKIDNLRIDKYYTLVRMFIREALSFCRVPAAKTAKNDPSASAPKQKKGGKKRGKRNASEMDVDEDEAPQITPTSAEWDVELVELMSDVIEDEVLTLNPAPIGLRLHMADVWVDEASAACGDDMPTEAFLVALAPWLRAAASPETNAVVFRRTFEGVFEELLKHFPEEQDGEDVEEGEGDVDGKAMFKEVELSAVQACLFEVAAAPRTRAKRRTLLYKLHRQYQQRTGVAPDANAPSSGILPSPSDSEDDDSEAESQEDDGDGAEFVEEGRRPRAVRGAEPPVAGWVAAGLVTGDIVADGGSVGDGKGGAGKRRRRESVENSEDEEAEATPQSSSRQKKRKGKGTDAVQQSENTSGKANGSADSKDADAPFVAAVAVRGSPSPSKKSRKRKKEEAGVEGNGDDAEAAVTVQEGDGSVVEGDGVLSSPPSSSKRKKKKKKRDEEAVGRVEPTESREIGAAADGHIIRNDKISNGTSSSSSGADTRDEGTATSPSAESPASSGKKKKKKKKKEGQGDEDAAVMTPEKDRVQDNSKTEVTTPTSSEKKKTKKDKGKNAKSPVQNASIDEESFQTPPKGKGSSSIGGRASSSGKKKKKGPEMSDSARKTVTFGVNMAKEHITSVEDLKTSVITPAKDGTPHKGLLKVGGGSGVKPLKPLASRKGTPHHRIKRAVDFF